MKRLPIYFLPLLASMLLLHTNDAMAQRLDWIRQFGESSNENSLSVAVDHSGNAYISGLTNGSLDGVNAGDYDAFLTRYNANGTIAWTRQLGTSAYDDAYRVAVDGVGNVYISGRTVGSLGGVNAGGSDVYLARYNSAGVFDWARQIGTSDSDYGYGLAVDAAGNAYISGRTFGSLDGVNSGGSDAFISRFDADGTLNWTRQIGTSGDEYNAGIATDNAGNVFIVGTTDGSLDGVNAGRFDAYLTRYDSNGTHAWTRQIGTPESDTGLSVAVDQTGNAYISGRTNGSLDGTNAGFEDVFLARFKSDGTLDWIRQTGTDSYEESHGVAVDSFGNAYITGQTNGSMDGTNSGGNDAFLVRYNADGAHAWTRQLGSTGDDRSLAIAIDGADYAYISGMTNGSLDGANAGEYDTFLARYSIAGDMDGDGDVDIDDINIVLNNFTYHGGSTTMTRAQGDFDGDGDVDNSDLGFVLGELTGSPSSSGLAAAQASTIPEPSSLVLLSLAGLSLSRRRNKRAV